MGPPGDKLMVVLGQSGFNLGSSEQQRRKDLSSISGLSVIYCHLATLVWHNTFVFRIKFIHYLLLSLSVCLCANERAAAGQA